MVAARRVGEPPDGPFYLKPAGPLAGSADLMGAFEQ